MSSSAANPMPTDDGRRLRVVLVGGQRFARVLRRDPRIELVRAATPLEAVGELADPIDAESPRDAIVLIDPEAEPAGELAMFIAGLRTADPDVRILRLTSEAHAETDADGYDGAINPADFDGGAESVRRSLEAIIRGDDPAEPDANPEQGATPEPTPEPRTERFADTVTIPEPARLAADNDAKLVMTAIEGRPVLTEALAILRRRVGEPGLRLGTPSEQGVPVRWKDRLYGVLTTDDYSGRRVLVSADDARWLASWLRLSEQHTELSQAAFTDHLTGAWNRRYFDKFLPAAIEGARQRRGSLTLMVFDIDDFKSFNDRFGHGAGDEILKETVRLLRAAVRPSDRVCRVGGDEFAVIFDEPEGPRDPSSRHPDNVGKIARRFQALVAESRFSKLGSDAPATLAVSAGLATFPWDAAEATALLERADQLAIESKRRGKNAMTFGPGAARECGEA